jgi:hypothetical protein
VGGVPFHYWKEFMGVITTKSVGIGAEIANPKPARGINWCGQPMKEGDSYWGESGPPWETPEQKPETPKPARVKRVKRSWTAEQLESLRARMAKARAVAKANREARLSSPKPEGQ